LAKYRSLQSMYKEFKKTVTDTIEDVVPPIMKEKMAEAIELEVYMRYSPTMYIRREEDGGLSDIRNMEHSIDIKGNKIIVTLVNKTRGNKNYKDYDYEEGYIDSIIITGTDYTWQGSKIYKSQPYPRDFYEKTNELLNDGEVRKAIIKKLKSEGLIVR